jgi:hypothetical protein
LQFAGTSTRPSNNIIVAIGSPFAPAYYQFKKAFKEKTRVEWDDRIDATIERKKKEKRERGQVTSSEDQGSRKGVAVSRYEEKEERERKAEEEFKNMPFEYNPPRFGPRGKLPKEKEIPADLVPARITDIEYWMSGTNGAGPDTPIDLTEQEVGAGEDAAADVVPAIADELPSIFDKDVAEWLGNNFDDHYPFDHTAENLEYLEQTNGQAIGGEFPSTDTFDTAVTDFPEPQENTTSPQQGISFGEIDTDAAEPPISFNLPSTVQESFELGTQDIGDTQMAERAQNEFLEFADLPTITDSTIVMGANVNEPATTMDPATLDLGSSILGKRKTSPVEYAQEEASKNARYDDEDEAFALAAEESFDADQEYDFTSETAGLGGDAGVPRAMLEEYGLGSIDEATGEMDEGVDTGVEDWVMVSDTELPGRA